MTPREVGGLQALAKAQGGSLTRNPETGLYEAGVLEQVLPIIAAGAAMYFTAGAATPLLMSAGMGATSAGILAGAGAGALLGGGQAAIHGGDVGKAALIGGTVGGVTAGIGGLGGGEGAVPTGTEGAGINAAPGAPTPGISPGPAPTPTPADPNVALNQSTQVGTKALNLNPSTGSVIDPLKAAPVPAGGYSGYTGPQAVPGPNTPTSTLTPTANQVNSALPGQNILSENFDITKIPKPSLDVLQDERAKQQTVAAAKADPNASWWSKQTPIEKAGYTTAGAGILAAMNPQQQSMPEEDTSNDGDYLKRISPNFRAQEPIQPNPYYRARYPTYAAEGGIMMGAGGIADLGSYSDGGRLLKGPGDGVSDNIPATIGGHQPARLADGEFVVPARIVSELGNGSTDAGAKRLYAMMERVQAKRKKSMGKGKFAVNSKAVKDLPA
jgi:hypothetical protein